MVVKIKNNQTILFIGDSITDCGRLDENRPLGDGYVKLFSDFMTIREPGKKVNIINKGISGNTVRDLRDRWHDDMLRYKPDWLSVKVGINDLHCFLEKIPEGVSPKEFFTLYDEILSQTIDKLPKCNILLIEPFYISGDETKNSFRKKVLELLPEYIQVVRKMSRKYKTRLLKTHDLFAKLLRENDADTFCPEPVHPNLTGHMVIAEAVYSTLSK
jgi:lysophospholipase L1-like esterase